MALREIGIALAWVTPRQVRPSPKRRKPTLWRSPCEGQRAEDGKGPDGHGWTYTFEDRIETLKLMFDRSYGRPSQPIQVD